METKLFMVIDDATEIPIVAMRANSISPSHERVLRRAGFGKSRQEQREYVIVAPLGHLQDTTYDWMAHNNRTMKAAHRILTEEWDEYDSGRDIDVRGYLRAYNMVP